MSVKENANKGSTGLLNKSNQITKSKLREDKPNKVERIISNNNREIDRGEERRNNTLKNNISR